MNIIFGIVGQTATDITKYSDSDSTIILTQELERQAFQRVVDDVTLRLSNLAGFFTTEFAAITPTTRYEVQIFDGGRRLFLGEIDNESINFEMNEEWVTFDAFSKNKIFWDRARATKVDTRTSLHQLTITYKTVMEMFTFQLIRTPFAEIFTEMSVDSLYANRNIRWHKTVSDPTIGNNGKFDDLEEETTVQSLLDAMGRYYNAEFFVNPDDGKFTMKRRADILSDTQTLLDNLLVEDGIDLELVDRDKADFVHTFNAIPLPNPPVFQSTNHRTVHASVVDQAIFPGTHRLRMSVVINGSEVAISDELLVVSTRRPGVEPYFDIGYPIVTMPIVDTLSEVQTRRLYVSPANDGNLFLWMEVSGNASAVSTGDHTSGTSLLYADDVELRTKIPVPVIPNAASVWIRYNEATQSWESPIIDVGNNTPEGRIFDIRPELRFYAPGTEILLDYSPFDIWNFFGREGDYSTLQTQYIDMFRNQKRFITSVKGLNYRVGDTTRFINAPNSLISNSRFLVRKAANNLNEETTELEMVSL